MKGYIMNTISYEGLTVKGRHCFSIVYMGRVKRFAAYGSRNEALAKSVKYFNAYVKTRESVI